MKIITSWILLFFIFLNGCNKINKEILRISFYNTLPSLIWQSDQPICKIKNKNEVRIFNGIIEDKIIESFYNKGNDVLTLSKECEADAVFLTASDLLNIKSDNLKTLSDKYPLVLTNIYLSNNTEYKFKKYFQKEVNKKSILIASVIVNLKDPSSASYINGYRIENPLYELNRILSHKADFKIIILNKYNEEKINFKKEKKLHFLIL